MDGLFLSIDGGGSGTRARLEDAAGQVLGSGSGGPANIRFGTERAWQSILTAAEAAAAAAGLDPAVLQGVNAGLGLAGACLGRESEQFLAHPHPFRRVVLESDAHAACLGAHRGAPGGIVIVGTGSVGYVWDGRAGRQIAGWGFPISDGGSGAWIGLEAIRQSLRGLDPPGETSALQSRVLQCFGGDPEHAVHWSNSASSADYATFAPLVVEQAAQGDDIAVAIMRRAAGEIAALAGSALAAGAERLALLGGLATPLTPWLPSALRERLTPPLGGGLEGAMLMIRQAPALASSR